MNFFLDATEMLGDQPLNSVYESFHHFDNESMYKNDFSLSRELIFGHATSGTANLWDLQQKNTSPMMLAQPYDNHPVSDMAA